ncbi:Asparagine synthase, glutamine-hydrolyzing [Nitrospira sp. KM1]|uniref:asparagine synthase (glutamine-hydrolyzing) n=1 Tax=Nitrospira sp. KM1 TaxID=1936990 RepID=UPI0013A7A549|nr:asparagine synthase (glutamine-hydrolyzing) [Nitrospira sp. KM1]BCA54086.1 Asparagine synthase, glutamine-hydrolyzing [Nitrospira sp. KM1]
MCGIAGAVYPDSGAVDQTMVRRMCARITRRGPDDEGFYFGDRVGLGMRRLAIIDVDTGKQPIHNEDRSVWVVFNGEIYNYRELQEDLQKRGHRLATSSDTECLVHLYEEFGEEFVTHLRGMFAFAIWDDRRKKLLLGRDRLGIKPFYYWLKGGALYFGSELKCLLAVKEFEPRIDLPALSDYLTFKYVPGPRTIYEGIRELPPAHVGMWSDGTFEIKRYWQLRPGPDRVRPLEYYAEGLLHHLEEAVRLHLISEVPLGAFLSGGVDSSAIVGLMSQVSGGKVKTFTIGFEDGEVGVDERPFARAIANRYGTDHAEYLYHDPRKQIESMLPAIVQSFDEPFADSSAIPNYMICEAARKYVTVALSGTGGDELFAGYERYRGALAAERYRRIPKALRQGILNPIVNALPEMRVAGLWIDRLKRFSQGADLPLPHRYQHYLSAFDNQGKAQILSQDVLQSLRGSGDYLTSAAMERVPHCDDPLDWMLSADMATYLPDDELRKTDRLSMWHSLEVRVPFLDHKVVEFVATIPAKYKLHGITKKYVLLKSLEGIVPANILRRRKQGFSIPLSQWLRGPLRGFMRDCLADKALQELGLLNERGVSKLIREHESGTNNHETKLWALLMLMLWHRLLLRNRSRSEGNFDLS